MTEVKAADLPEGSVVAWTHEAWIKGMPGEWFPWRSTRGSEDANKHVQEALDNGAQVLRHGTGEEVEV